MIRILIADDHELFRAGLRMLIANENGMKVVGESATGRETVEVCKRMDFDVLLLDLTMPDISGMQAAREILLEKPDSKILLLTMHDNEKYAAEALEAGAKGYILKGATPEELAGAIRKVAAGGFYISPDLAQRMVVAKNDLNGEEPLNKLSEREREIVAGIAAGRTRKEIAKESGLSLKTIETYKSRAMTKLNLNTLAELIHFAIAYELVPVSKKQNNEKEY